MNSKSKKGLNACDVYIGLGIIYYLQGVLYPPGIIAQAIQLGLILWGIIVTVPMIGNFKNLPVILKAVTLLMIMYSIYGAGEIFFPSHITYGFGTHDEISSHVYLQSALNSLLPFLVLYLFYKKGELTAQRMRTYFFMFAALAIVRYFQNLNELLLAAKKRGSDAEEFTNNIGYQFLNLFPFVFFFKNKTSRYTIVALILFALLICMKRGAILIGALCAAWFLMAEIRFSRKTSSKIFAIILGFAVIIGAIWYVEYLMANSDYFMARINQTLEGKSSHRDVLYSLILDEIIKDPSPLHLLFGRGANSTVAISGNYAHQDWLELMANNGLLGVILGAFFYGSLFYTAHRYKKTLGPDFYTCFLMASAILFVKTMFSMSIYQMSVTSIIPIAYLMAYAHARRLSKITHTAITT